MRCVLIPSIVVGCCLGPLVACSKGAGDDGAAASQPAGAAGSMPASMPASQPAAQPAPEGAVVVGAISAGFVDAQAFNARAGEGAARLNKPIRLEPLGGGVAGVLIADISNHAVRELVVNGETATLSTVAGGPDAPGDQDTTDQLPAQLNAPHGVARLPDGTFAIAEASGHALRLATRAGQGWRVTTLAGQPGQSGFADGPADKAQFSSPHGLCAQPDGGLIIADIGNKRLRRLFEGQVTTVAGTGAAGSDDGPLTTGTLSAPIDVHCLDNGAVLIADAGSMSIRRYDAAGGLSTLPVDRPLQVPHSVTVDPSGRILVAELEGNAITEITGGKATVVWGTGTPGAAFVALRRPADVLVDGGLLWVADLGNHQVKARPWPPQAR